MDEKKLVPQGVYLACDKGALPTELTVINHSEVYLFEEPVATTADMIPMVNIQPFGTCMVTGSACMPVPIMWEGFEDGVFIGEFNPLLEDSVLQCGVGGRIKIYYSLAEAQAACPVPGMSMLQMLGTGLLVVAAVGLVVLSGGAIIAAVGALAAATTVTGAVVGGIVLAAEVAGLYFGVKALQDYEQDSDEEALFKEVALGYLFLGVGKAVEKGFKMLKGSGVVDEVAQKLKETRALLKKKKFVRVVQKWGGELVESIEHKGVRYVEAADDPKVLDQAVALASRGDDLPRIADNLADELGLSGAAKDKLARQLAEVKEHYWKGEHLVEFEQGKFRVGRFSKQAHDIQLWEAAENGFKNSEQLEEFKQLIAHEYTELKLMEEGLPYRGMDTSNWDKFSTYRPTSSSYGAHDLAPNFRDLEIDRFNHWQTMMDRNIPENLVPKDDLSNLDELVEIIKNIEGLN